MRSNQTKLSCGSTAPSPFSLRLALDWILTGLPWSRSPVRSLTPTPSQLHALRRVPALSCDKIALCNRWRIDAPAAERGGGAAAKICITDNHANLSRIPDKRTNHIANLETGFITAPAFDALASPKWENGMIQGLSAVTPEQLKRCRNLAGLSVGQFARQIGVGRATTIREMERGDRPVSGPIARCALVLAGLWPFDQDEPELFQPLYEFSYLVADGAIANWQPRATDPDDVECMDIALAEREANRTRIKLAFDDGEDGQ